VPTIDTLRNRYLIINLLKNDNNKILVVGHTGVGKTALIENILLGLESSISNFSINLSAQTSAV